MMKKCLLAGVLMYVCSFSAVAQKRGERMSPEEMTDRKVEQLDKALNLDDSQEKSIRELYAAFYKQRPKKEERKAKVEALNKAVSALLTDEQKKTFQALNEAPARKGGKRK